jgi:hypothetical protein
MLDDQVADTRLSMLSCLFKSKLQGSALVARDESAGLLAAPLQQAADQAGLPVLCTAG